MGKPVVGEVIVLPFPQTNLQTGKRRPALAVADLEGEDRVLCPITSRSRRDRCSISLSGTDSEQGRLAADGYIRPNPLFSAGRSAILYPAAKAKPAKLDEVRGAIRNLPE